MDQMLWADPNEGDRTINVFVRAMGTLQGNRNLISISLNAGLTFHEPIMHRDGDTLAIGMGGPRSAGRQRHLNWPPAPLAEATIRFAPARPISS